MAMKLPDQTVGGGIHGDRPHMPQQLTTSTAWQQENRIFKKRKMNFKPNKSSPPPDRVWRGEAPPRRPHLAAAAASAAVNITGRAWINDERPRGVVHGGRHDELHAAAPDTRTGALLPSSQPRRRRCLPPPRSTKWSPDSSRPGLDPEPVVVTQKCCRL